MNNCYFYTHDPILTLIYDRETAIDYFGEDGLEEFGSNLPEELIDRFKKNQEEFWKIQEELNLIKNNRPGAG